MMIEKETGVGGFDKLRRRVNAIDGVAASSAYIQGSVFLESATGKATGIFIRGIVPETEGRVTKVDQYLVKGEMKDLKDDGGFIGSTTVIIGGNCVINRADLAILGDNWLWGK